MQVSIESTSGLKRKMTVELPAEQVKPEVEKRLREVARNVRMDGFRPGKVPLHVVRQRYGREVQRDVLSDLIQKTYPLALKEQQISPASDPSIELLDRPDEQGVAYSATFEVLPEVKVGELSGVVIQRPAVTISEADIDRMIERLRQQRANWNESEEEAHDGDRLTFSFSGTVEGESFEGGSAENVTLVLGSEGVIDGFGAGLAGVRVGEDRSLEITLPQEFRNATVAGKNAHFEISVSKVEKPDLPEMDDAFCREFGVDEGGIEALRGDVRSNMERELRERINSMVKQQVMDALLAATELELPSAMVEEECKTLRQRAYEELNLPKDGSVDIPLVAFDERARRRVALGLIIAQLVEEWDVKLDAARLEQRLQEMSESFENPIEMINFYRANREYMSVVEGAVLEDQVIEQVLAQQVQIVEEPSDFYSIMSGVQQTSV